MKIVIFYYFINIMMNMKYILYKKNNKEFMILFSKIMILLDEVIGFLLFFLCKVCFIFVIVFVE